MIYLDNAATTRIDDRVLEAMLPYLKEEYGNPGSIHALGMRANNAVEKARKQVADFINASPEQIIFTSGGSEANNLAIKGVLPYIKMTTDHNIIISDCAEHSSLMKSIENVCIKHEFDSYFLGVKDDGSIDIDDLKNYIKFNDVALVSIMYANNELGTHNDIKAISKICAENNILFHTDCVQAAGFDKLDVQELGCDMMSISSHKIHGCKGMGCLYVKDPEIIAPIISGGSDQEFGYRGGTENVAGIVGFGKACEIANEELEVNREHISHLSKFFVSKLNELSDKKEIQFALNSHNDYNKTINVRIIGVDAETLILFLSNMHIMVSAGSACNSKEHIPSHVLTSIGLTETEARESIRVSFSKYNSEDDVLALIKCIKIFYDAIS